MKITPPTISDELKKLIMRMKNSEATSTDNLLCFKYGENDFKK